MGAAGKSRERSTTLSQEFVPTGWQIVIWHQRIRARLETPAEGFVDGYQARRNGGRVKTWLRRLWRTLWYDELREYRKGVKLLERRLEPTRRVGDYERAEMHEVRIDRETLLSPLRSPENSPEGEKGEEPKSL